MDFAKKLGPTSENHLNINVTKSLSNLGSVEAPNTRLPSPPNHSF